MITERQQEILSGQVEEAIMNDDYSGLTRAHLEISERTKLIAALARKVRSGHPTLNDFSGYSMSATGIPQVLIDELGLEIVRDERYIGLLEAADPAHVLVAAADSSAKTHVNGKQEFFQRGPGRRQDNADA